MGTELDALKADFDKHRQEWLREGNEGRWAVVAPKGLFGFFASYQEAFLAANKKFGDEAYLIQQVLPQDRVESVQLVYWN